MSGLSKNIVVLGAGVVGLTTAVRIQEKGGYNVTILAEILPSDPKSIRYTSQWAGAHHVSLAGNDVRQQKMDQETFKIMWDLSAPGGEAEHCFLRIPQQEFYAQPPKEPHELSFFMPSFKVTEKSALTEGSVAGVSFETITIETPRYLNYLMSRFLARGGTVVRGSVHHIANVIEGGAQVYAGRKPVAPDAVVVCVGIGARQLGGVMDPDVFPIRGQTVTLAAPWIRFGMTLSSRPGVWTYIIPRRSGDVIVGGLKGVGDWYPAARPETTRDILERAIKLCPELAPPEVRAQRTPTIEDLIPLVIEENCGLRPGRTGGIRLETEWMSSCTSTRKVPVIHNYGHGGYGFQSSWGSASIALELLEKALAEAPKYVLL
ncbi:nucleotide-binding domain-containing protein [Fistulina hepatica ATCC 64428]|uniref:Nucleotide-binding domain-containing protein n=1 Tax=Fistulina hepatica ATCC 64428 TaxID=1128425 RepID=A0A0D7AF19_9AGAR|nr:nucleotide-binding domain-containing protein [Fistulina hepatica ATCC 64428]